MHRLLKNPYIILVAGFGLLILIGALLLLLPISTKSGQSMEPVDAFFTATSSVCVTGLSVFDPGSTLSGFGQGVMLVLIQLGGIGFMTMTALLFMMLGRRLSLWDRVLISDSFNDTRLQGVARMVRNVLTLTLTIEAVGVVLLALRFVPAFGVGRGLYYSVFHAVSSFCNAGFDVFGQNSSLIPFVNDPLVNMVTMGLIVLGGLGFYVLVELRRLAVKKKKRMSLHTKIVLWMTGLLIAAGFVVFLLAEGNNPETFGAPGTPQSERVWGSLFQSVTTRTAGFASVAQDALTPVSKVMSIVLMFIGGSPAGTAGGIKTTTFALLVLFVLAIIRGKRDVEIFKRRIHTDTVLKAVATVAIGVALVFGATAAITVIEHDAAMVGLQDAVYEVVSAFGTVGLSLGVTPLLAPASKIVLMGLMYCGRVGVFTFTMAMYIRLKGNSVNKRYAEEKLLIG